MRPPDFVSEAVDERLQAGALRHVARSAAGDAALRGGAAGRRSASANGPRIVVGAEDAGLQRDSEAAVDRYSSTPGPRHRQIERRQRERASVPLSVHASMRCR